jgi:hypothetical protein
MRDILNLLDNVAESRGLSAREPGSVYKRGDTPEDQIVLQNLTFYPEVGRFNSKEETEQAFAQVQKKLGHPIEKINEPSNSNLAFAIATFDTAVGTRYLAKFAQEIKPVRTKNTFFQTKDIPGEFSQSTSAGSKEKVGYKPSQVLKDFKSQTPQSILSQIATRFGQDSDEYRAAKIITGATAFPVSVPAGNMDFAGFRDYFCEMLQPIVLIQGQPVKGNAARAAEVFMDGTFSDCVVSFNTKPSGELYDSLLVNPAGKQIKLSSKGATGAMASSVNLLVAVRELEAAGMTRFRKEYAEPIRILEIIDKGNHNSGPLKLAVDLGMITPAESQQVMSLSEYDGVKNFDIDNTNLSKNLKKIYKERTAKDVSKIVPLNHMVSSIAYKVCNEINLNTNFSDAAADILNNSAFVQMYTEAKKGKDEFVIQGFNTIWPSKLFTQVTLEAEKSYSSTSSSSGKLVFNINKQPKEIPNVEKSATTDAPGASQAGELVDYIPPRSAVTARAGGVDKDKKLGSEKTLGRKRQK